MAETPLRQMVAGKLADIAARKAAGEVFKPAKRRAPRCVHGLSIYQECADCNDVARVLCGPVSSG